MMRYTQMKIKCVTWTTRLWKSCPRVLTFASFLAVSWQHKCVEESSMFLSWDSHWHVWGKCIPRKSLKGQMGPLFAGCRAKKQSPEKGPNDYWRFYEWMAATPLAENIVKCLSSSSFEGHLLQDIKDSTSLGFKSNTSNSILDLGCCGKTSTYAPFQNVEKTILPPSRSLRGLQATVYFHGTDFSKKVSFWKG